MADTADVVALLHRLAEAWASQDKDTAAGCFTENATYIEPPDVQIYTGREQLRAYFRPLPSGTYLNWHGIWFDVASQTGAAEFSFGIRGNEIADHGVVVFEIEDGLLETWREYPRKGPSDFAQFTASEGKDFRWHIGNYP